MTAINGDVTLLGQRLLCMALEEAKDEDPSVRAKAHWWLTAKDNYLRDLILEAVASDIHQDWIDDYVEKCKEEFDEQHAS